MAKKAGKMNISAKQRDSFALLCWVAIAGLEGAQLGGLHIVITVLAVFSIIVHTNKRH